MKRGKDGEKVMGPMFPRLHVNDADKGGPRAPPRNKMALYEQLSIPSQRFNPALLPANTNSNNSVPRSSSSKVCGLDRKNFFAIHLPPSKPTFHPEKLNGLKSDRSNASTSFACLGQHNRSVDEDDFTVPIFAHSQEGQEKYQNSKENENFVPLNPNHMRHHSTRIQTQNSGAKKNLVEPENIDEEESKEVGKCSCSSGNNESPAGIEVADAAEPRWDFPSSNTKGSEDVSEASILDSISAIDISPDDIMGIIGQKHFWKARRAIVNQQRVFAVQVFELHRLIKVQKLIAGSPHLLLEDTSTNTSKQSSKSLPATKLFAENNDKSLSPAMKHGDKPKKPTHPVECSAENAVGQMPVLANKSALPGPPMVSSSGTWCQPEHQSPEQQQWLVPVMSPTEGLVYKPYSEPGFGSTGFSGSYSSSTMMMGNFGNPAYGVPAHHGMGFVPGIPHAGHSYFPTYGKPVMSSGVPAYGYGSIYTVEPGNRLTESTPAVQTGHILRQPPNRPKPQNTCNNNSVPVPRPAPVVARLQTSKVPDIQGSIGSSPPNDRTKTTQTGLSQNPSRSNEMQGTDSGSFSVRAGCFGNERRDDGKDELPLFPMAPASAEADQSTRVIRAVPHNARSASASVARIFRSIQEGRKHYDSV